LYTVSSAKRASDCVTQGPFGEPVRFLDTEFRRIQRRTRVGTLHVDVLAGLSLLEGGDVWLLVYAGGAILAETDPDWKEYC